MKQSSVKKVHRPPVIRPDHVKVDSQIILKIRVFLILILVLKRHCGSLYYKGFINDKDTMNSKTRHASNFCYITMGWSMTCVYVCTYVAICMHAMMKSQNYKSKPLYFKCFDRFSEVDKTM